MSFGGSPSDIVNFARLCHDIYSFCHTAPTELQGLSNRLQGMERKLYRLSAILDRSNLGTWERRPELEQHLLDARACLEPLLSAINKAISAPSRAMGLTRLALNQGKLRRIEKGLDVYEKEINDMKIDLILVCSLRNIRCSNDHQLGLEPPPGSINATNDLIDEVLPVPVVTSTVPLSSEAVQSRCTLSSVSSARIALMKAMRLSSRPNPEAEAVHTSDLGLEGSLRDVQMADDFITEVVSLAEETELYAMHADPPQNLEQMTQKVQKATQIRLALHSSNANSTTDTAQYQLQMSPGISPDSFEQEFFSHLSSMSDDTSMRMWASNHTQRSHSGLSHTSATEHLTAPSSRSDSVSSSEVSLQEDPRDNDDILRMSMAPMADAVIHSDNEQSTKDQIHLSGWSKVSLTMNSNASSSCSFDFEVSEGSVLLKVIPTDGSRRASDTVVASVAPLTPWNSLSRRSQSMSHGTQPVLPGSFQHCLQSRDRPIPHLLHPEVEGPSEEPDAPYTITFRERQYISMEGAFEGPRWTTSLMYIFHEKDDRNALCEKIFGKTLLTSTGSDRIKYDGREISHMSSVTLWLDDASGTQSMTFSPNLTTKTATPKDMELRIYGLCDPKQAPRNPNAVAVLAESMPVDDEGLDMSARPDRQPSVQSRGTLLRRASSNNTSQKGKKSGKLKCIIEFGRSSDKASFLGCLK